MEDSDIITFGIESNWLSNKEKRLKASSFSPDVVDSVKFIQKIKSKGIKIDIVSDLVDDIFYPPRFKRIYSKKGDTFLSSKDIFDFLPVGKKIKNASEKYFIENKWILVTRSGTTGRVLMSNGLISKTAISEHVIRIIPSEDTPIGYLYVYLLSKIGQSLLKKEIFGGVVNQIEPQHIGNIPIPRISSLENKINRKINESYELLEEAQNLFLEAEKILYNELLPKVNDENVKYFAGKTGKIIKSFEVESKELNLRLDASYHIPLAHLVTSTLKELENKGIGKLMKLKEVSDSFVPSRFKRPYVKKEEEGIPLLQGTHITQTKPQQIKYIWKDMRHLDDYIVLKNWVLVTCSGTIGHLSLVSDYWVGWAATNHLLRLIPFESIINPGYLVVYLLSIYGQIQFQRLVYGGVVDEIGEAGELIDDILILKPDNQELEYLIGSLVIEAYKKRDESNKIEEECIKLLENELSEIGCLN